MAIYAYHARLRKKVVREQLCSNKLSLMQWIISEMISNLFPVVSKRLV